MENVHNTLTRRPPSTYLCARLVNFANFVLQVILFLFYFFNSEEIDNCYFKCAMEKPRVTQVIYLQQKLTKIQTLQIQVILIPDYNIKFLVGTLKRT